MVGCLAIKAEFKQAQYRAVETDDMKAFIEKALRQMLKRNCTRRKFSERYRNIIDQYNAGSADNEHYYEELVNLLKAMQEEDSRASREGLMDEDLPDSYDKNLFAMKTDLLMAHFTDMAVQGYGWVVV